MSLKLTRFASMAMIIFGATSLYFIAGERGYYYYFVTILGFFFGKCAEGKQ